MTAKTTPWLALVVFRQYFLVLDIIALANMTKSDSFTPILLLFLIVGAGASWGLIMQYGAKKLQGQYKGMIPYPGLGLFGLVGYLSLMNAAVRKKREENSA